MDNQDYKVALKEFYSSVAGFMMNDPRLVEELKRRGAFFRFLKMGDREKTQFAFDWFIFDVRLKFLGKTVFEHWLENTGLEPIKRSLYVPFRKGIFSLFEITALRTGKEMMIRDLIHEKDYQVQDETLSKTATKNRCVFVRVLPFRDYFILTGGALIFPMEVTAFMKLSLKNRLKEGQFSLNPLTIAELYFAPKKPERLPIQDRFILFCEEAGLEKNYLHDVIERMKAKAAEKADFYDILDEVIAKLKINSKEKLDEVAASFTELWNSFAITSKGYVGAGPIEKILVGILMDDVRQKVNLEKEEVEEEANRISQDWIKTPLEELGNRTPEEVILEEREKLGNPQKEVKFNFKMTEVAPGRDAFKNA